jgi:capsule polysaccharide export protein KpsE/RkpR
VLQNDFNPASIILQRLKAEESLKEVARQRSRLLFANNVRTIWSERTFLVRISTLGLILGVLVSLLIPVRYTTITRLMPPGNQSGSSIAMTASMATSRGVGGFGDIAGDLLGLKSTSDVFVGILSSQTVQTQIIQQFDLKTVYGLPRIADARRKLTSRVDISVDRKSQIIAISVSDSSPQRAADIAKAYVDQLNRLVSELNTSSARRERIFLESRLSQVNEDLQAAEKEFSQFSSKNSAIDIKEQGRAMLQTAATLQGQLMLAESELQGLQQIYTDSNVRVRALQARVAGLQSQLQKFGGKDQGATLGQNSSAEALYPSIRKLPLLGVTYADLYRRTKVQETVYEVLTQEYELAKVQEAREIPTVKILDLPEVPEKKDFPPRTLIAVSTAGLGCLSGIGLLLATKTWNEMNPDDLGKAIATEILIDLKEKRFLNSVNTSSQQPTADPGNSLRRKGSILSFLGLNITTCNGSTHDHPEDGRAVVE